MLVARLASLEATVERLASLLDGWEPAPATSPRLLSCRAAAKRLGVSRNTTLLDMIKDRRIRVVTVGGRSKIPLSEVERIERDGSASTPARAASLKVVGAPVAGDVGARIRALKIA
jgi:excisionase family DNA binding protein